MYIVYMRERYYFSLVCTFEMVVNFFQVKVDVQKKVLRYTRKVDNICVNFIQSTFLTHCSHMVKVLNDYLVHSC